MIAVGQTIGNYTITAKLGEGGMGVVYLAEHPVIGRKVAMKAIHPELSRNPEVVSRFVTEAKSVNQIGNEHIVDIHDFGTTPDGEFYFIMEFLQGEALSDVLKQQSPMDPVRALAVAAQVADALAASHQHGIIHRDLKPENIFLITKGHTHDFVKVLDFGLAKLTQGEEKVTHKTRTGSVMGTPYYMAPEQCEGKANIDHRADIYSLGVILYEMLTGRVPFSGDGYGEIIVKHITSPVPPAREWNPNLSPEHEAILMRALAKPRDARFQTMEEFAAALLNPTNYAASAPPVATTPSPMAATTLAIGEGASPRARADSVVSGQVLFGKHGEAAADANPNTYRATNGEISDDDLEGIAKPKRTGLWIALAGTAVVAGSLAFFLARGAEPAAPPAPPPVVAPTPVTITIQFNSEPDGAQVIKTENGEILGTTPFSLDLPAKEGTENVVFKKPDFKDEPKTINLSASGKVAANLEKLAPPEPEKPEADPDKPHKLVKKEPRAKKAAGARRGGSGRSTYHPRPMDEDGVLPPSF
jgi:serine/threonine protein kinase